MAENKMSQENAHDNELKYAMVDANATADFNFMLENARQQSKRRINYAVSNARIEANKALLIAKRSILNSVYEQAITKLMNMTDNLYRELMAKIIEKYAENNDTIVVSERDQKRISYEFIIAEAKKLNINLTLSPECHNERGGIIFLSKTYDKNVTFKTLIEKIRIETESKIAKKLFES